MIIADEQIPSKMIMALRENAIHVLSVKEDFAGLSDEDIITLSNERKLIILTEDKDFGEWIFAHGRKGCGVLFLRYRFSETNKITETLINLIIDKREKLFYHFTTLTIYKIRTREI
ncbi:MAG: hypothetical protein A3H98_05710 [Bacteroidetes bacterium RIFCSPLOWO2_02_FULL_36_8]|nr:MAG: hypothetical protein A3H98_05710 [Bacteroidetes bacterium RIFCSPLOWO2_02_FULL_36_8]OFY69684.1 MAG: hypothetical protein A3G23_14240 [Bacteroidetes bacterium RIFCSPLOWO2_12_FULL_37_12]